MMLYDNHNKFKDTWWGNFWFKQTNNTTPKTFGGICGVPEYRFRWERVFMIFTSFAVIILSILYIKILF